MLGLYYRKQQEPMARSFISQKPENDAVDAIWIYGLDKQVGTLPSATIDRATKLEALCQ
jgi:hypothetical protein